jgi:(2Fe-2S) ferredoxin
MSKQHQQHLRPLTGYFLGWGDDRTPHGHIKLATSDGERLIKVAKSLRRQIQDWQPGICLELLVKVRICRDTGIQKIKVKQISIVPNIDPDGDRSAKLAPCQSIDSPPAADEGSLQTKIQICQGSSCRKRGSEQICQSMQAYLEEHNLTDRVQIEPVKCLHQCKTAPHAIVTSPDAIGSKKTHYRQIQSSQMLALLAKHFPIDLPSEPKACDLTEKVSTYLQQLPQISTAIATLQVPG